MHAGGSEAVAVPAPSGPAAGRGRPARVSVVLPVRDGAVTLPDQLEALARQTYTGPWELLVVDNGSRDGTGALVDAWTTRLPARRVTAAHRSGVGVARNVGIRAATGDLLVFCDADDVVEPAWLDAMVRAAADGDLVGGRLDPTLLNPRAVRDGRPPPQPPGRLARAHGHLPYATGASLAIWSDVARALGGFDERFRTGAEDIDLSWRAQAAGHRLVHAPDAVTRYRYRHGLAAAALQAFRYGIADTRLFHHHREHLPRPRPVRRAGFLREASALLAGSAARRRWCWRASFWLGQHAGTVLLRLPDRAPPRPAAVPTRPLP